MAPASEQSRRLAWEIEKAEDAFVTAYAAASVQERAEGNALLARLNRALAAGEAFLQPAPAEA